jgi:release factor glutamine methyltransferase
VTLLELLNTTSGYFEKHGVPQARLNAELLIADALGLKRLDIYLQFDRPIADAEREKLRPLVRRRAQREPLQHVMGWTEFCGLRLSCDSRALVPRPETECLVEEALHRSAAERGTLLDIGTGTGAIALAFLAKKPAWKAFATDVSPGALELAQANAAALGLSDRITFLQCDLWPEMGAGTFDLIAANPPYIASAILPATAPEVQADPPLALDGGPDGLDLIRRIIAGARERLAPGASLLIEIGDEQGPAVRSLLVAAGLEEPAVLPDLNGRDRIAAARPREIGHTGASSVA